jgi:hypothetical protein
MTATADMLSIIRLGAKLSPKTDQENPVLSPKVFLDKEARILADMQLGVVTLREGSKIIGALEASPGRVYEFQMPTGTQLLGMNSAKLNQIIENNRAYFINLPPEKREALLSVGLCGKGENELDNLIQKRSGIVSVSTLPNLTHLDQKTVPSMEGVGLRAYNDCVHRRDTMVADPTPGGIIAVRKNGEAVVELTPKNFGQSVVAIVGFERVRDLHGALQQIYSQMENHDPMSKDSGNIVDLQSKEKAAKHFISHVIFNDILKCV